ncbi:MAG: CinA family nicotinamide mononucleotide deamidase-related protein [Elusimicrobia bacterium]|nr:CinA family nicotinamide mononucleotide deamidase-related protein [Elusimicrobiota bacterium]
MKTSEPPKVEVVCVGSELLSGRVDTHTAFLARRLAEASLRLDRGTTVPDALDAVRDAVAAAAARAEVVLVCGGLGPTFDDLTREAVAAAFGRALAYHAPIYAGILRRYGRYGLRVPSNNKRQAFLLGGARALDNPHGSAPGQRLEAPGGRLVYLLPGPPSELYPMFEASVLPELKRRFGRGLQAAARVFRFYGLAEAACDQRLAPVLKAFPQVDFTILADLGLVELHAAARAPRLAAAEALLAKVERRVAAAMGEAYFSREGDSLPEAVGNALMKRGWRLATAESCSGGLLSGALTGIPGSSRWFVGGATTYSNALKTSLLGVSTSLLRKHGAVSEEVVRAMVQGTADRFSTEVSLAVTGIAGPEGGTKTKPVGLVYMAAKAPGRLEVSRKIFPGTREQVRRRAVAHSLSLGLSVLRS